MHEEYFENVMDNKIEWIEKLKESEDVINTDKAVDIPAGMFMDIVEYIVNSQRILKQVHPMKYEEKIDKIQKIITEHNKILKVHIKTFTELTEYIDNSHKNEKFYLKALEEAVKWAM